PAFRRLRSDRKGVCERRGTSRRGGSPDFLRLTTRALRCSSSRTGKFELIGMNTEEFEDRLKALRPRLHRYCARMTGSAVNGEDVLQDTLVKALRARAQGAAVENLEGWLFRIAHNASLDFLRDRSRNTVVPLTEDVEAAPIPEADLVAIS